MKFWIRLLLCAGFLGLLSSCQSTNLKNLTAKAVPFLKTNSEDAAAKIDRLAVSEIPIGKLLDKAVVEVNVDQGIKQSVRDSVGHDPEVLALESQYKASKISVDIATSQKEFTVSVVYMGVLRTLLINIRVALVVDARRLIYDGGQLDSQISSENLKSQSLFYSLLAKKMSLL